MTTTFLFRWAVEGLDSDAQTPRFEDLKRDGWERGGSHPIYPRSHLMFRIESLDDSLADAT